MNASDPWSKRLFDAQAYEARELTEDDLPELQAFFVANPDYFLAVNGRPPQPDEARHEFEDRPPPEMTFEKIVVIGFYDKSRRMVGMACVISNLFASQVWHIGLFIVATALHGTGTAKVLYEHLERWVRDSGASWLRLGAVEGNAKAERFWEKVGYQEVRRREGVMLGDLTHTIRVFVKPLGTSDLDEYLQRVARDRPEL
jgi:GNAT superfamily N-acetyltransferase